MKSKRRLTYNQETNHPKRQKNGDVTESNTTEMHLCRSNCTDTIFQLYSSSLKELELSHARYHVGIDYQIKCCKCAKICHEICGTKKDAETIVNNLVDIKSMDAPIKYYKTQFIELLCCADNSPTEILIMIMNWVWKFDLYEEQSKIVRITLQFPSFVNVVAGRTIPPKEPHKDMIHIRSGVSYGAFIDSLQIKTYVLLTGKFLISGVCVNNVLVKRNQIYCLPGMGDTECVMVSFERRKDGLYVIRGESVATVQIVQCGPLDTITLDHLFSSENAASIKNMSRLGLFMKC